MYLPLDECISVGFKIFINKYYGVRTLSQCTNMDYSSISQFIRVYH